MSKPSFIELGAPQSFAAPFDMRQCRCYGFMLKADLDALTRFVDGYLNAVAPPDAAERYRPAMDRVMFGYSDMGQAIIGGSTGYRQFSVPEIDVAFWIPVVAVRKSGGSEKVDRFGWLMTFVNVDNIWAVVSGREIYGFPKGLADVRSVAGPGSLESLTLDTMAVERFGPEAKAELRRFVSVTRSGGSGRLAALWRSTTEAASEMFAFASGGLPGSGLLDQAGDFLRHRRYPLMFLKQFRDIADPAAACYQAVAEAPVTIGEFRGGGLLTGDYTIQIEKLESHPVVEQLGLEGHTPRVLSAFHSDFDFVMECGKVIWERR